MEDVPQDSLRLHEIALEWKSVLTSGGDKMCTWKSLSSADDAVEGEYGQKKGGTGHLAAGMAGAGFVFGRNQSLLELRLMTFSPQQKSGIHLSGI